jgi:hypothetical protein
MKRRKLKGRERLKASIDTENRLRKKDEPSNEAKCEEKD